MNTCEECNYFYLGSCLASGYLGCSEVDLTKVKPTDNACETHFEEIDR